MTLLTTVCMIGRPLHFGISHSQSLLERLERSQLFIQPLDSHGHWYRYHTLFLDFLRSVLRRDAARIPILHERASRWFAEHQLYEAALQHAFLANDPHWRLELGGSASDSHARCCSFTASARTRRARS